MARSQAWFNDGQTAARREVEVELDVNGLRIGDPAGGLLAVWPYESLRHREEPFPGQPTQLRQVGEKGRLVMADPEFLAELTIRAPQLVVSRRSRFTRVAGWLGATAAGVLMLVGVLWYALPAFAGFTARLIPVSWEEALGDVTFKQFAELLARMEGQDSPRLCDRPGPALSVLEDLTARLAAVQDSPYRFQVTVLDGEMVNAFALPGGRIVLLRGLFDFVESPDELAAVMAHEMGHVIHQHGTEQMVESLGLTFFFGVMLGDIGSGSIGLFGETMLTSAFSRDAEREADQNALSALADAGLASGGLADFFRRLQGTEDDMPAAFNLLSTHPSHGERIALAEQAGQAGAAALTAAQWDTLKTICDDDE